MATDLATARPPQNAKRVGSPTEIKLGEKLMPKLKTKAMTKPCRQTRGEIDAKLKTKAMTKPYRQIRGEIDAKTEDKSNDKGLSRWIALKILSTQTGKEMERHQIRNASATLRRNLSVEASYLKT
jgi:hypothetical protein